MADAADPEDIPLEGPLIEPACFDIWVKTRRLWTIEQGIQLYLGVEPFDDDHDFLSLSRELLNKNGGSRGIRGWRVMARDMFARAKEAVKSGDIRPFKPVHPFSIETDYRKVEVLPSEFMRWLVSVLEQLPDGLRYTIPSELLPLLETDADDERQDESRDEDAKLGKRYREHMTAMANKSQNKAEIADNYWKPFIEERDELIRKGKSKLQASTIVSNRHEEENINRGTLRQK